MFQTPSTFSLCSYSDKSTINLPSVLGLSRQVSSPPKRAASPSIALSLDSANATNTTEDFVTLSDQPPLKRSLTQSPLSLLEECAKQTKMDIEPSSLPKFETMNSKPMGPAIVPQPSSARAIVQESFDRLFGPNFSEIRFKQGPLGNCYLVAVFDALIHHPMGEKLLRAIKIETIRDEHNRVETYRVTFPSKRVEGNVVEFPASEFGPDRYKDKLLCGPAGLRILELAYMKLVRNVRNKLREEPFPDDGICHTPAIIEGGNPHDVLRDMFGGESVYITPRLYAKPDQESSKTDNLNSNEDAVREVKNLLWHTIASSNNYYFLCAKTPDPVSPFTECFACILQREKQTITQRFTTSHAYSIRSYDPIAKTVTVANPHDTAQEVITLTRDEFCHIFRSVSGLRIPKNSLASSL